CEEYGITHLVINAEPEFIGLIENNDEDRCYLCKTALFAEMYAGITELGIIHLVEGSNADDEKDFRPGAKALLEMEVASPLKEVGLTKAEIREELKARGIPYWDKPSYSCLATRIPFGEFITEDKLEAISVAEATLRTFGFKQVRARIHGELGNAICRIEVPKEEIPKFFDEDLLKSINDIFKGLGFKYVSLDLGGYKQGNMNPDGGISET
ncbi:MAG: ATP-dependent sacrificial sulfur transferase LarE, partial [Anaerovoracaceae bacterium]